MNREQKIAQAEKMFIIEGKDIEEIARVIGYSRSSLYRIMKERNWKERRLEYELSAIGIAEKLMRLLHDDVKNLSSLNTSEVDRIVKVIKSIKVLQRDIDILGSTIKVVDELIYFLREKFPDNDWQKLFDVIPQFLEHIREKYKNVVE